MTARLLALAALALVACRTTVDADATAIEIATHIDANDGVTQLRVSGTIDGMSAFDPGVLPTTPRPLSGEQTLVVLLPSSLDGAQLLVRVDALAGDALVHTGGATVEVRAKEVRHVDVTLGDPAICGDAKTVALFETCDDGNTQPGDGCSPTCAVEAGWSCTGMPSQCNPLSTHKEITSYAFLAIANPGLHQDVIASINGTTISASVPFGTNVNALVATFAMTGTSAKVSGATQVSGATPNDFTGPVVYTITADDGSVKTYTVSVAVATAGAKDITSYRFLAANNTGLSADVVATINSTSIVATVPFGTDVSALVATFETTGASVTVGATVQTSNVTPNNFAAPVMYTVTSADSSTKIYTVTVAIAASSAKDITAFAFRSADNPTLGMDVTAAISGTDITVTVPSGTDVAALVATFSTTGASVAVGATPQMSGATANDFTNPVIYTVTAADTSMQMYTVTVGVAASSAKDITSYMFASADNPTLSADVTATITGTAISATVPNGTNVSALVATFATTGATVTVGGAMQTSGVTANNFAAPIMYVVTAADGSMKTYTVTVTIAQNTAKDLTAFEFTSVLNPGLTRDIIATINGTSITATLPYGSTVTSLVATFATTGVEVDVGAVAQTSGVTANNFTSPLSYVVHAADGSTKTYTVTVMVAAASDKDITFYEFLSVDNSGLAADAVGVITGTSIAVAVPIGTNVTALVARFSYTGKLIKVGTKPQVSGVTPNSFTAPVAYIVSAHDNTTKTFTVTVTPQ